MRSYPAMFLALLLLVLLSPGCSGPSVWERSFSPEPGEAAGPQSAAVVVREAPWERVSAALASEREQIASSEIHRDDWDAARARAVEEPILKSLQLPGGVEGAELIGRSNFKTTHAVDPSSPDLARFARSIGADYAIWSRQVLGKADAIEREPVWRDAWRMERIWDADRGRYVYTRRWEPDTVWVPFVIRKDEVRYVVFYVRSDR